MNSFVQTFSDIILERQLELLADYVPRTLPFARLSHKAIAVIGVRRSGKTTFLRQIWDELLADKQTQPPDQVYVNFFDERLFGLTAPQLGQVLDAHHVLFPRRADAMRRIFLDEIQVISGWERFVDRLLRDARNDVYLTGSSATLLSTEVATAMRGRSIALEMFPFAFSEVLDLEGLAKTRLTSSGRAALAARAERYLYEGGFPETVAQPPPLRRRILQDYLDAVLMKDVIDRHRPKDVGAVSFLLRVMIGQVGAMYTLNKLHARAHSAGHKVTKSEVSDIVRWFHDAYLFFSIPIWAESQHRREVNPRKLYCIDTGMAAQSIARVQENRGHLLENAVYLQLRRQAPEIFYWKNAQGHEVNFLVPAAQRDSPALIQVCESIEPEQTRKRELRALEAAMGETGAKTSTLVTMLDDESQITTANGEVHVLPLWRFLTQ